LITIKDIAKKANVSTGTVDRVIHNRPGVSLKTKERIDKIIKESNFEVNKIASTLAFNKNYTIAVLIPESKSTTNFWSQPNNGILKAGEEIKTFRGELSFFYYDQFDASSYIESFNALLKSEPDAALMAPVFYKETVDTIHLLDELSIPYLFININVEGLNNISFIGQHSFKSGYLAAKLMNMLQGGAGDILIPIVRENIDNHLAIDTRISGFKSYFKEKNQNIHLNEISISNILDQKIIHRSIGKQLEQNSNIRGVFVPSSYINYIAKYFKDRNLTNLKLIGFDLNEENIHYLKDETIDFLISQNAFVQGYDGIKTLFDFIANKITPEKRYYSPIKLLTKENIDYV
jgi:LacI family transcriptional regulator